MGEACESVLTEHLCYGIFLQEFLTEYFYRSYITETAVLPVCFDLSIEERCSRVTALGGPGHNRNILKLPSVPFLICSSQPS